MKQILMNKYVAILVYVLISTNSIGQVKTRIYDKGIPSVLLPKKTAIINELIIKAPAGLDSLVQSSKTDASKPIEYDNKFALPQSVNINFLSSAKKDDDNDTLLYSLSIKAEKAINISAQFREFKLSPNAILSIYTENALTDSITSKENNENNIWATRVYQGNVLNMVLKVPKSEIGLSDFTISQISFGYKKYGGEYFGTPGSSAPCNINVLCPQGNSWQNERNAVVFLLVEDGTGTCTGSMIMNTCNTNTPYLLTANHCLGGNLNNWVFQYQYWSTTCTPNTGGREDIQFNGCTLRANNATTDFALVEMNQTPSASSGITYAGWNRGTAPALNTVQIHHPASDLMKISLDANAPVAISWPGIPGLTHWRVHFQQGTVQPGSSGSPLFDQNHRIIGQCHGDQNNTGNYCAQQISENGRFDLSWTGGGTNSTRLSNWLDPSNSGAMTTNTTNISALIPTSFSISGDASFCTTSNPYTIPNLPVGATVTWSWSASPYGSVQINSPNSTSTTLTKLMDGTITLTATINNTCGINQIIANKQISVGNPLNGTINQSGVLTPMNTVNSISAGATSVSFQWSGVSGISCYQSSTNPSISQTGFIYYAYNNSFWFTLSSGQSITVSFSGTGCNGTTIATRSFNVGGHYYVISPNPASGTVTISPNTNSSMSKTAIGNTGNIQVSITDVNGILRKQQQFSANAATMQLNVSGLIPGTYFVQIINGDIHDTQQLIINR